MLIMPNRQRRSLRLRQVHAARPARRPAAARSGTSCRRSIRRCRGTSSRSCRSGSASSPSCHCARTSIPAAARRAGLRRRRDGDRPARAARPRRARPPPAPRGVDRPAATRCARPRPRPRPDVLLPTSPPTPGRRFPRRRVAAPGRRGGSRHSVSDRDTRRRRRALREPRPACRWRCRAPASRRDRDQPVELHERRRRLSGDVPETVSYSIWPRTSLWVALRPRGAGREWFVPEVAVRTNQPQADPARLRGRPGRSEDGDRERPTVGRRELDRHS